MERRAAGKPAQRYQVTVHLWCNGESDLALSPRLSPQRVVRSVIGFNRTDAFDTTHATVCGVFVSRGQKCRARPNQRDSPDRTCGRGLAP
jgi:hypothetical protein